MSQQLQLRRTVTLVVEQTVMLSVDDDWVVPVDEEERADELDGLIVVGAADGVPPEFVDRVLDLVDADPWELL